MKDFYLLPIILVVFTIGYFLVINLERFIKKARSPVVPNRRAYRGDVRIAAENKMLLDSVESALENCSASYPYITASLSSGSASRILKKLLDEETDIVLLTDESAAQIEPHYASLRIPYENRTIPAGVLGLPVEALYHEAWIYVVWKKNRKSKIRDCVIAALENEHYRLKCGYVDYLD